MLVTACGIATADIIAVDLSEVARPGQVVFGPKGNEIHVGGHVCNLTIDLVQMGLKGREVSAIISVGEDPLGDFLVDSLKKVGVVTHALRSKRPTSSDLILVVRGEDRRFHVDVGANQDLAPAEVLRVLRREKPSVFFVGAAGILGGVDARLPRLCREAKSLHSITFTSVAAPYGKGWEFITPSLQLLDILHCNNVEASGMTGLSDPVKAVRSLGDHGVKVAIVTMGEKGLYAQLEGRTLKFPAFAVRVVDPTGAGDAFCAGVAFRLTTEPFKSKLGRSSDLENLSVEDWKEIFAYASACGAACCTAPGTTTAVKPPVVRRILREQSESFARSVTVI